MSSVPAFERYHRIQAQLWERQALIKARAAVGDRRLMEQANDLFEHFVYAGAIGADGVAEIQRVRGRMEHELARETAERFNFKTGRGGIVDIEFLVQMLQFRYGQRFVALRQRNAFAALDALTASGIVSAMESQVLTQGYQFLRRLENRLRIERDQPVEALESDAEQLTALARGIGDDGAVPGPRLLAEYQRQGEAIRACYSRLFV